MSLVLIALAGLALAWLARSTGTVPTSVPVDLWDDFERTLTDDLLVLPASMVPDGLNTVGGMDVDEHGFVSARAAALDPDGALWLDVTAVVHPTQLAGRVQVRRDADGYHLQRGQRDAGRVGLWDPSAAQDRRLVRVASSFD